MSLASYCASLEGEAPAEARSGERPALDPGCVDVPFAFGRQFYSARGHAVLSIVPKVASSALKYALLESEHPWLIAQQGGPEVVQADIHRFEGLLILKSMAGCAGAATVRVLRDPALRMVSAYLNKFTVDIEPAITRPVCGFVHKPQEEVSFEDFLWYLVNAPNFWLDQHFRPQADFFPFARYDHTFNLDAGPGLGAFVEERLGVPLRRVNDSRARVDYVECGKYCGDRPAKDFYAAEGMRVRLPAVSDFLTDATRAALRRRYLDDYAILEAAAG